jgi:hypothetical protein
MKRPVLHIKGDCAFVWKRSRVHILHRFADAQATQHGSIHENTKKVGQDIVEILTGGEEPGSVSRLRTRLEGDEELVQLLLGIIREERDHLGDTKFDPKYLERTVPQSRRYSLWSEAWCNKWHVDKENDPEEIKAEKQRVLKCWCDADVALPHPFSLLPLPQYKRRMVQYEGTGPAAFMLTWVNAD